MKLTVMGTEKRDGSCLMLVKWTKLLLNQRLVRPPLLPSSWQISCRASFRVDAIYQFISNQPGKVQVKELWYYAFSAFSGSFLQGFSPFNVLPLSSTFPLFLLLLCCPLFLHTQPHPPVSAPSACVHTGLPPGGLLSVLHLHCPHGLFISTKAHR